MANTDSLETFTQAVFDLLTGHASDLGVQDVFFGDQAKIPSVPSVCVDPLNKRRELQGVPRMTLNTMQVHVIIYHARVADVQVTSRESLQVAEGVEALLHSDAQLGGLCFHSMCSAVEAGYSTRSGTLYRSTRITFEGESKTSLPYSAI